MVLIILLLFLILYYFKIVSICDFLDQSIDNPIIS
jgi:hypothetical protein